MKSKSRQGRSIKTLLMATLAAGALTVAVHGASFAAAPAITSPRDFFGFDLGSDGMYVGWAKEVEYFQKIAAESDRVDIREIGKSAQGRPMYELTISSPANLAKKARLQEIAKKMADPRGLSDAEIEAMVAEGKAIHMVTLGQHSTEVASSQMGPLLVYHLATATDEVTMASLENAVMVLIPSFNPDGLDMVKAWTDKTKGTPYQGSGLPELYHWYVGHDNNRDAYMLNMPESKVWADVAYRTWYPQIYQDTHQQGAYASRLFLPPKTDPVLPDVQPIIWRQSMLLGAAMATRLEAAGIKGVETQAGSYTSWQMPTFHGMTPSRNIVGFHTESASAKLIWPLEVKPEQLQPADRGRLANFPQVVFPNPWPGGVWRMSDIVKQQKIAILATLEAAARQKSMFLSNMALMGKNQVTLGQTQAPYAHVVTASQHDGGTRAKMLSILMEASVEVHRVTTAFQAGDVAVRPGDYIIRSDQPLRGYIHSLLVPYMYPDNVTTRRADGTPLQPKDFSSTNLGELMGVNVVPVTQPLPATANANLTLLTTPPKPTGRITGTGRAGWMLTPAWNDSFQVVNAVLAAGGKVSRLTVPMGEYAPGAFWIPAGGKVNTALIEKLTAEFGVSAEAMPAAPKAASYALKPLKVGLYYRYQGGNSDEGWTRWIFDTWKFPYTRVNADDVTAANLNAKFDVIILPPDSAATLVGRPPNPNSDEEGGVLPPEFNKSLGEDGVAALKAFAQKGGTVVFMDDAAELALDRFDIPVTNSVKGLARKDYYAPGSLLKVTYDITKPLAYGMPKDGLFLSETGAAYALGPGATATAAATFPSSGIIKSGWLLGESKIAGKPNVLDVPYGSGRLVLLGFAPNRRAETHGTYKVLFNAMYLTGAPR